MPCLAAGTPSSGQPPGVDRSHTVLPTFPKLRCPATPSLTEQPLYWCRAPGRLALSVSLVAFPPRLMHVWTMFGTIQVQGADALPSCRMAACALRSAGRAAAPLIRPPPLLPRSLAIGPQYSSLGTQPILCASIPGLVPKQLRFCRNYVEIMPSVAEGIKISIQECQHQFRGRRWNCTTVNNSLAIFGPVLDKGTRAPILAFRWT